MITIKVHQYFYFVIVTFSRLILTPCLTIDSFSLVDIALKLGSIKTSWLSKGLVLLFELVIPSVHRANKQNRNFVSTTFCSFGRNRSPYTSNCNSLLWTIRGRKQPEHRHGVPVRLRPRCRAWYLLNNGCFMSIWS